MANTDDAQFASSEDFELDSEETSQYSSNEIIHSVEKNSSVQLDLAENDSKVIEQDITTFDDLESELSEPPEEFLEMALISVEPPRRPERAQAPRILFPEQISYGSSPISRELLKDTPQTDSNLESLDASSSSARFTSTHVAKPHAHLVQILRMLESNIDNEGQDEPGTLKQAICCSD